MDDWPWCRDSKNSMNQRSKSPIKSVDCAKWIDDRKLTTKVLLSFKFSRKKTHPFSITDLIYDFTTNGANIFRMCWNISRCYNDRVDTLKTVLLLSTMRCSVRSIFDFFFSLVLARLSLGNSLPNPFRMFQPKLHRFLCSMFVFFFCDCILWYYKGGISWEAW